VYAIHSVYKSPEYEQLAYDLIIERLVDIGYPQVSLLLPNSKLVGNLLR